MQNNGRFIIVDGIDGSGKSTVLRAVQTWAEDCQHHVFKLSDWMDVAPPRFEDVRDFDVYFTYEPTRTWVGRAIRYELSRVDEPYDGEEVAQAFALDRQIMYRRLIIPALNAGKTIIQDRSVSSSLVYQPIMPGGLSLEAIMNLPGNKLALSYPPNALILTKLPAQQAIKRLEERSGDPKDVFEKLDFMKKLEARFAEPWFRELYESRGTTLYELDTSGTVEATSQRAQQLIDHILTTC